jgi:SPP1 family predicted phage head-tail adaptor
MLRGLAAFYPSTCAIQERTDTRDALGQPIAEWADVSGMARIACRVAPAKGQEIKAQDQTYVKASHVIALAGHYAGINEAMRAVVGGQVYDILLVEHDGQGVTTRLQAEIVR